MMKRSDSEKIISTLECEGDRILTEIRQKAPDKAKEADSRFDAFYTAVQRYAQLVTDLGNEAALSGEKPKRNMLFGYVSAGGGFGRGQTVHPVFLKTDALNNTAYGPEKAAEGTWGKATEDEVTKAETQLEAEAAGLWQWLSEIPGMNVFLSGSGVRVRQEKYDQAAELVARSKRGDDDYMRGMEYYARLDTYRDSAKRFAACNNALFFDSSKLMLLVPVLAAFITVVLYVVSHNRILLPEHPDYHPVMYHVLHGIPWGLLAAVIAYGAGEAVLMIGMLLRKHSMQQKKRYTGGEPEWTILDDQGL